MKKISVVVPVYNMEKYLPKCVDSLINQALDKEFYEIILIDDGSTDASASICDQYAAEFSDFITVIHKKNGGLCSARNVGIDNAKGEFVIFPDPDDWVERNYLEALLKLQDAKNPDLACLGFYVDDSDGSRIITNGDKLLEFNEDDAVISILDGGGMCGFAWNKLYRLDIIKKHHLYFLEDSGTIEDLNFAYRYLRQCKYVCFDPTQRVYHYFQREGSATHAVFSQKQLDTLNTFDLIIHESTNDNVIMTAREKLCTAAANLILLYFVAECKDASVLKQLNRILSKNIKYLLRNKNCSFMRKVQTLLAWIAPRLYYKLKTKISGK